MADFPAIGVPSFREARKHRTEGLIAELRAILGTVEASQRLEIAEALMDGYCGDCGHRHPKGRQCRCEDD